MARVVEATAEGAAIRTGTRGAAALAATLCLPKVAFIVYEKNDVAKNQCFSLSLAAAPALTEQLSVERRADAIKRVHLLPFDTLVNTAS